MCQCMERLLHISYVDSIIHAVVYESFYHNRSKKKRLSTSSLSSREAVNFGVPDQLHIAEQVT